MVKDNGKHAWAGNKPAWHNRGVSLGRDLTAQECIEYAGLDFVVAKSPLTSEEGDVTDHSAIVRTDKPVGDSHRVLSIVKNSYQIVQYKDAFKVFDRIIDRDEAVYDSVGVLGKGERMFLVAKLPKSFFVDKDEYQKYITVSTSHDYSSAIKVYATPVRTVCSNTLTVAMRKATSMVYYRHTKNVHERMLNVPVFLGLVDQRFNETQKMFNQLVKTPLTHPLFNQYVSDLFPSENPNRKTLEHREGVAMMLQHDDQRNHKDTFYGAFNALTQYVDHSMQSKHGQFENAVFGRGNQLKQKALTLALEVK